MEWRLDKLRPTPAELEVAVVVSPAGHDVPVLAMLLHVHIDDPAVVLSQRLNKTVDEKKRRTLAMSHRRPKAIPDSPLI